MKEVRVRFLEEAERDIRSNQRYSSQAEKYKDVIIDGFKNRQAFLMPSNGKILDDGLKGLPDTFRLPFDRISLLISSKETNSSYIVFATMINENMGYFMKDDISLSILLKNNNDIWDFIPAIAAFEPSEISVIEKGRIHFKRKMRLWSVDKLANDPELNKATSRMFAAAASSVCELVEALSCANVNYVKRERAKSKYANRPLMYDEYYELMVETGGGGGSIGDNTSVTGTGRHPREHLCRGHIRNQPYKGGVIKKIWINAVIKGAGNGGGKITKTYNMVKK
jgi:hypothetical protein